MVSFLPKYEILFYITVYIVALVVGFYHLFLASKELAEDDESSHFDEGWFKNSKRDDLDFEWEAFTLFVKKYIYWYIQHAVISEITRFLFPQKISLVHAVIGFAFILLNFSQIGYLIVSLMLLSFYIVMRSTKRYIWSISIVWLILLNVIKQDEVQEYLFTFNNELYTYEVIILSSWIVLRLISFSIDYANARIRVLHGKIPLETVQEQFSTINYFAYILYIPTILTGPPFVYARYLHMMEENKLNHRVEECFYRILVLFKELIRMAFWWIIYDLLLHFFYVNNFIYNSERVNDLNIWAFYGLAYGMGQFFCTKYVITYGFGIALSNFDRINAPDRPKCVAYIHLYSNMWKYFDQGLHEFLFNYIYDEIRADSTSKLIKYIASFITFKFIFIWHGCYQFILIWALLNFICLHLENYGKKLVRSNFYKQRVIPLGQNNCCRINAIAGSQLYILAVISNMIFIGGVDIGMLILKRTYIQIGLLAYIILSFLCYCLYQTSEWIVRWQAEHKKKEDVKKTQ